MTVSAGFPAASGDLAPTDWGTGGVPAQSFAVPKFDPSLGTLESVALRVHLRSVLDGCVDNQGPGCLPAQLGCAIIGTCSPSTSNTPLVTGLDLLQLQGVKEVTPLGFLLGASDGFDDCAQPGVTSGPPSVGDCAPGADHLIFSAELVDQSEWLELSSPDLAPWIGPTGTQVVFDSSASALFIGAIGPSIQLSMLAQARAWIEVSYRYCPAPTGAVSFCDCVASGPCGNTAAAGEGCANGTGSGARLSASGTDSVVLSDLQLQVQQLPPSQPVLFFQGNSQLAGGAGVPFGDGLRCAGGAVVRLEALAADLSGLATTTVALAAAGGVSAGDVRRYQAWYRDPQGSPCGTSFNLSNGLELVWQP